MPKGGGTIYLATVDGDGNAVSLIESNYMGFGSGVVDPETGIHYQNRGSYFSPDPRSPERPRPRQADAPHAAAGDAVPARRGGPWVVTGQMGGDAQPQILAQVVSALVDGGVDVASAVAAPRWFVEPARHLPRRSRSAPSRASRRASLASLAEKGHPVLETAPFDGRLGHAHAIELVDGGPGAGGSVAAATDPRSAGLPAVW